MSDFETQQHEGETSEPEMRLAIRNYVRFVALGDSASCGVGDPTPGGWRGWARILADATRGSRTPVTPSSPEPGGRPEVETLVRRSSASARAPLVCQRGASSCSRAARRQRSELQSVRVAVAR